MTSGTTLAAQHDAAGRHDEAINELARATQAGDIEAMTELGKRLVTGDRAPLLAKDGAGLLLDAMRAGSAEAAVRIAVMAALGAYTEQSWERAFSLLVQAAEKGSASARGQLHVLAHRPPANETPSEGWRGLAERIDLAAWLAPPAGVTLHERPTVRRYAEFVTDEVCDWLMALARGRLNRALIYDPACGGEVADQMRTNSAAGFDLMNVDLVHVVIQHRMAAAVGLPVQGMEGPTVLHYKPGEQITEHFDFVNPRMQHYEEEISQRGERIITFLIYLNDGYEGGETEFPALGIHHKGRRGEALFFTNALPDGKPDLRVVHAGRPPGSGEKWVLSQFVRNRPALNRRAERIADGAPPS